MSTLTVAKQHISSAALEPPYWNDIERRPVPSITEVPMPSVVKVLVVLRLCLIFMLHMVCLRCLEEGFEREGLWNSNITFKW